jgi:hypothetical protein
MGNDGLGQAMAHHRQQAGLDVSTIAALDTVVRDGAPQEIDMTLAESVAVVGGAS